MSIASNNSSTTLAKVGDIITVTATSSENIIIPTTFTIDGQAATFSLITGSTTWKGVYTIVQGDTEGVVAINVAYADSAGNSGSDSPFLAATTSQVIVDTTAPTITIAGSNPLTFSASINAYTDAGATASDSREGTLTSSITTNNTVNASVAGAYSVIYSVSDSAGNTTSVTRTVTVSVSEGGGVVGGGPLSIGFTNGTGGSYAPPGSVVESIPTNIASAGSQKFAALTTVLKRGMKSGSAVQVLQQMLNSDVDTQVAASGVGSSGHETTLFGVLTEQAVKKFQKKYSIVSSGTPITTGYGAVGPKTRAKLNLLFSQ